MMRQPPDSLHRELQCNFDHDWFRMRPSVGCGYDHLPARSATWGELVIDDAKITGWWKILHPFRLSKVISGKRAVEIRLAKQVDGTEITYNLNIGVTLNRLTLQTTIYNRQLIEAILTLSNSSIIHWKKQTHPTVNIIVPSKYHWWMSSGFAAAAPPSSVSVPIFSSSDR